MSSEITPDVHFFAHLVPVFVCACFFLPVLLCVSAGGKVGQAAGDRDYQGHDIGTSRHHEKEDGMVMNF